MKTNRYPGVSSFTKNQQNIFFGREEDIKKLKKLILLRDQVLLYSKSGIGKTSLLNAGVIPQLNKKFTPINIRFTAFSNKNYTAPTENTIQSIIIFLKEKYNIDFNKIETPELDEFFAEKKLEKTLWYYFKKIQLSEKIDKKIILVFDQFEELFSYPEKLVNEFKQQLAELTRVTIPDSLIELINTQIGDLDNQDDLIDKFSEKIHVKTIFAIRSDRLSELNILTDKIPDIQDFFYELKPLNYQQITEAIIKPALEKDDNLETQPFEFQAKAIETIINELSDNKSQIIETTQLQIVCQQIEEIADKKRKNTLEKNTIKITKSDLPKFDDIFFNFYDSSIKKLDKNRHEKAKTLIEDELIKNNLRISIDEEICKQKIDDADLKKLVDSHLLRAERNNFGRYSYELSHDTLVTPILESRKNRLAKIEEEKAKAEQIKALEIAKQKAEKERIEREKERKRQRTIIAIVSIAAVISIAFGIFGFWQMQKAKKNLSNAIKFQVLGKQKDAISFKTQEEYSAAIGKYNELLKIYRQNPSFNYDSMAVYKDIKECDSLKRIRDVFNWNIDNADSLITKKDLESIKKAYIFYEKAKTLNYPYADKKIDKFNIKLKQTIDNLKLQAATAKETGGVGDNIANEIFDFLKVIKINDE